MIVVSTDNNEVILRYNRESQLIEMTIGSSPSRGVTINRITMMRPHQVLNLVEGLKALVAYHDIMRLEGEIKR